VNYPGARAFETAQLRGGLPIEIDPYHQGLTGVPVYGDFIAQKLLPD
jgi:hypothetical protein